MSGECMGVGAKCQEAGERQGNVWEWVQSARGMQGNATGMYGSGCKVPEECRRMQGNAGECQGVYGSGCKVPGECRAIQGNARELMGVGATAHKAVYGTANITVPCGAV